MGSVEKTFCKDCNKNYSTHNFQRHLKSSIHNKCVDIPGYSKLNDRERHNIHNKTYYDKHRTDICSKKTEVNNILRNPEIIINKWKSQGVIHDDFNKLFTDYINSSNCGACNKKYLGRDDKFVLSSFNTGIFKMIICQSCKSYDKWKDYFKDDEYSEDEF